MCLREREIERERERERGREHGVDGVVAPVLTAGLEYESML